MNTGRPVHILLVEDDPGHAVLIRKNLQREQPECVITVVENGEAALAHLFQNGGSRPGAELILLDLNLPVLDGCQVLAAVRSDARTRRIPVVMLTTTDNPHEIARCYDLGCSLYITKPVEYDQFTETMRLLGQFISLVALPGRE